MRRLIGNEGAVARLGPITRQETMPISAVSTEANIVQISTAASPDLTPQAAPHPLFELVHRVEPDDRGDPLCHRHDGREEDCRHFRQRRHVQGAVSEMTEYMIEQGARPVIVQEFAFKSEDMTPQIFSNAQRQGRAAAPV
ncbi:type 1 periplasmic-binding domain-containing protein [Paracoccus kondratievae]|uniref:hypothetical protein n=1 Tax=Paracoccus kondratievae TaxID=135740 RepID=UPI0018790874|nr:hypothetical protein [Paracoccus kondratievae]